MKVCITQRRNFSYRILFKAGLTLLFVLQMAKIYSIKDDYKTILLYDTMPNRMGTLAIWQSVALSHIVQGKCPESRCQFVTDRALMDEVDAVLFNLVTITGKSKDDCLLLPHKRPEHLSHQLWILSLYEASSWWRAMMFKDSEYLKLNGMFNWTMTFRRDADVLMSYGTWKNRDRALSPSEVQLTYPSWVGKRKFSTYYEVTDLNKMASPVVWFGSNCHTTSKREIYINELGKFINVDIYGKCGPYNCSQSRYLTLYRDITEEPCFEMVNKEYAFIVAFENSLCKDYATEKAFNALLQNAIPLIFAGNLDPQLFPPHSVIHAAHFKNPQHLAQYLHYLLRNETAYYEYFEWRAKVDLQTYFSAPNTCDLCYQLHNRDAQDQPKTYDNLLNWVLADGECFYPGCLHSVSKTSIHCLQ